MEKFKLADFKVSSIRIDDMLNVMGGSGGHTHNDTGTCGCLTCTTGAVTTQHPYRKLLVNKA